MEDKDRFIEELVDSALAQQQSAEPRPGLEGRILERVRAAGSIPSTSRKLWTIGTAVAAAAAVVVAGVYVARRPHSPAVHTPQAGNILPAPAPRKTLPANSGATPRSNTSTAVLEIKRAVRREMKPRRRVEAHHWPSQFPTPAPLSPEEEALIQYVRNTPPQVLAKPIFKAEFAVQRVNIKPLKIAPLEMQPLSLGSKQGEMQ